MIYISKLFSPISTGTSAGDIDVGATVKINENGQPLDYLIVHQGLPSSMYDASCDGTWCLRKDIAENRFFDSNDFNVLETSDIQAYLNGDWMNRYDPDVAEAIKQVKIPYRQGGGSTGTDQSGANGLSCKAFLLSGYEVGFTNSIDPLIPVDGAKLSYFLDGIGSSANSKRVAKLNGSATDWWLRSPYGLDNQMVMEITNSGDSIASFTNIDPFGVRPCISLPYDFKFQEVS